DGTVTLWDMASAKGKMTLERPGVVLPQSEQEFAFVRVSGNTLTKANSCSDWGKTVAAARSLLLGCCDVNGSVANSRPIAPPQSEDAGNAGADHPQEGGLGPFWVAGVALGVREGPDEPELSVELTDAQDRLGQDREPAEGRMRLPALGRGGPHGVLRPGEGRLVPGRRGHEGH